VNKRDTLLLSKIQIYQKLLRDTVTELRISSPKDLTTIHAMMRRGMVQTVADIFEFTVPLSDEVLEQIPFDLDIIKQFRNTASHNYGTITNELAYACIVHCIDKPITNTVKALLDGQNA